MYLGALVSASRPASYRRHRCRCVRRVDRARTAAARRACDPHRRVGTRPSRAPAPAARRASSARPTARVPSTRRWRFERWSSGERTTPVAGCCARPASCGCSATTTALVTRRRRCSAITDARLDLAVAVRRVKTISADQFRATSARCSSNPTPDTCSPGARARTSSSTWLPKAGSIDRLLPPARSLWTKHELPHVVLGGRHAARGRCVRLRVRTLASVALSGRGRRQHHGHPSGGLLLRHAARRRTIHGTRVAGVDGLCRRLPIGSDLRDSSGGIIRIQGRRRCAGAADRSDERRADGERRGDRSRPRIRVAPVSRTG